MADPMTTPPLDLPALESIARAATPGPWVHGGYRVETVPEFDLHRFDVMGVMVADCDLLKSDAAHIAAFDPPTVLALLDRLEAAERDLAAVTVSRDGWQTRAKAAEKKVAAVREAVGRYYVSEGHACDDMDTPCALCVADEAMDALGGQECPDCAHPHSVTRCAGATCDCCDAITALDTHTPETETTP